MSDTVDVLIVVDVEGALSSQDLGDNVYLVDTNKHVGSGNEGQNELLTACADGQLINWSVVPVAPDTDVEIVGFTGQMVGDQICVPTQITTPDGNYWEGRVEARGTRGNQQYSVTLSMDGSQLGFDPYLVIAA
jgi:hypothetical protein